MNAQRPADIRLTDLADPIFPDEARSMRDGLAAYGATLTLNPETLLDTATERTGLADWGEPAFRERLFRESFWNEGIQNDADALEILLPILADNRHPAHTRRRPPVNIADIIAYTEIPVPQVFVGIS